MSLASRGIVEAATQASLAILSAGSIEDDPKEARAILDQVGLPMISEWAQADVLIVVRKIETLWQSDHNLLRESPPFHFRRFSSMSDTRER